MAALTCPHHLRNVDPTLALVYGYLWDWVDQNCRDYACNKSVNLIAIDFKRQKEPGSRPEDIVTHPRQSTLCTVKARKPGRSMVGDRNREILNGYRRFKPEGRHLLDRII